MALEDILKKIEEKYQKDVGHVKREAKEKCNVIKKEIDAEIKELRKKSVADANTNAQRLKEHMLQDARLKVAKGILKAKSDVLDGVFKEALRKLESLSPKDYITWMGKIILKVVEPGENEIILPKRFIKASDIEEFLKDINKKLNGRSRVKLSKKVEEISGGFMLKKPKKEINCSFKSILEEKRNNLKVKISKLLF